ncbi:unnamed protein product [Penicillium salamii]|nr:unnamed protein product [Penicillium salamii]CAG8425466.1 unnamed protein product [Penicillium salamii]
MNAIIDPSLPILSDLVGTKVTVSFPFRSGTTTWEILEKITGKAVPVTEEDVADYGCDAFVTGKLLCRRCDSGEVAFMRFHQQIPVSGTEFTKTSIRAAQATGPFETSELLALKTLTEGACEVVPRLLGYRHDEQGEDDIVPGGFITYVIWEKVAGDSLDSGRFWSCSFAEREEIRTLFRRTYEKLLPFKWRPRSLPNNIIYDWHTKEMHISGFDQAHDGFIRKEWDDVIYLHYWLVYSPSMPQNEYYPIKATDVYHDSRGWKW